MPAADTRQREAIAAEICEIGRRAWALGFCAGHDGNYSVRLAADRVLCTPTGVSKGFMSPDMLVVVDRAGRRVEGEREATSEILAHLAIYAARPDVAAVVHAHAPHAVAFCMTHATLPVDVTPEATVLLGRVPMTPYAMPGTHAVAEAVTAALAPYTKAMLLANHGPITMGSTLTEAWFRMEVLDAFCRQVILARALGAPRSLAPAELDRLREAYELT